jgi:hypothetical protein
MFYARNLPLSRETAINLQSFGSGISCAAARARIARPKFWT